MDRGEQRFEVQWLLKKTGGDFFHTARFADGQRSDDHERQAGVMEVVVKNEIPAAHCAHAEIGDDEVGMERGDLHPRLFASGGGDNMQAVLHENAPEAFEHGAVVVHEEDHGVPARRGLRERAAPSRKLAGSAWLKLGVVAWGEELHDTTGMPAECHRVGIAQCGVEPRLEIFVPDAVAANWSPWLRVVVGD